MAGRSIGGCASAGLRQEGSSDVALDLLDDGPRSGDCPVIPVNGELDPGGFPVEVLLERLVIIKGRDPPRFSDDAVLRCSSDLLGLSHASSQEATSSSATS